MSLTDTMPAPAAAKAHATAQSPALIEARNLSIAFGGIRAVDDVSFGVAKGEIFAIVGPNGAGKSTIFNLISRIYEPTGCGSRGTTCSTGGGGGTRGRAAASRACEITARTQSRSPRFHT